MIARIIKAEVCVINQAINSNSSRTISHPLYTACSTVAERKGQSVETSKILVIPSTDDRYSRTMGLLQLAVAWYMLEGKLPTGTSKTKTIQIYLDEVALFWMSQWAACPPACIM